VPLRWFGGQDNTTAEKSKLAQDIVGRQGATYYRLWFSKILAGWRGRLIDKARRM
jgi:hypothetical protein